MISTVIEALCVGIMCAVCYKIGWNKGTDEARHVVIKLKEMKDTVGLLQELNDENDQITSQLLEAKRLLKLAVEDYPDLTDMWRYADKVMKLIGGAEDG